MAQEETFDVARLVLQEECSKHGEVEAVAVPKPPEEVIAKVVALVFMKQFARSQDEIPESGGRVGSTLYRRRRAPVPGKEFVVQKCSSREMHAWFCLYVHRVRGGSVCQHKASRHPW